MIGDRWGIALDTPDPKTDRVIEVSCIKCGYNLTHLPAGDCPECGQGFDPDDLRRVNRKRSDRGPLLSTTYKAFIWLMLAVIGFAIMLGVLGILSPAIDWLMNT